MKHLILGGARSGKSRFAEQSAIASGKTRIYIATAQALDGEMQQRIAHHKQTRSSHDWTTLEEPLGLATALQQHCTTNTVVLVDCLTLWLTNIMLASEDVFQRERAALLDALPRLDGDIILVSNEVGMGVVPADPLSRRFVDETGRLHQQIAVLCQQVTLIVAGLPVSLKRE